MDQKHKRIKILFVQAHFGKLSEVFLYRMCTGLKNLDISVLTGNSINHSEFPFEENKINVVQNTSFLLDSLAYLRKKMGLRGSHIPTSKAYISFINQSDADLVCFQFGFLPALFGTEIDNIKKKFCIIHHGTDVNRANEVKTYCNRLNYAWKKSEHMIFASNFLKKTAISLGCPPHKASTIYLGVPFFSSGKKDVDNKKDTHFICVARLEPVKNHINLVRAFAAATKESTTPIKLTLIGEGNLKNAIETEIKLLNMEKHIQLKGGLNNDIVLEELSQSDCLLTVSKIYTVKGKTNQQEGLSISLLEGGGMGLPLIGSHTGGIPEVVKNNITGYLIDPLNINDIKGAILKITNDPENAQKMGRNAKSFTRENFNMEYQLKQYQQKFEDIVNNSSKNMPN